MPANLYQNQDMSNVTQYFDDQPLTTRGSRKFSGILRTLGLYLVIVITGISCLQVPSRTIMEATKSPLECTPEEGCILPENHSSVERMSAQPVGASLKVIYFTDPICSSCWGIEPQLRKLKLEYGHLVTFEYHMGGLLPDWSYNSGGISKPSDVAGHWDEVSAHYQMPIDGDVWLEDPLDSSYPPSIAFKAAQLQDTQKALVFLRRMREMVFLEKKNITRWEHLESAASYASLDPLKIKVDMADRAKALFQEDLQMARMLGVRGFPTLFFQDPDGNRQVVYGFRAYQEYEKALTSLVPGISKKQYSKDAPSLFSKFPTLTTQEFAVLSESSPEQAQLQLKAMVAKGELIKWDTKNGPIWKRVTP